MRIATARALSSLVVGGAVGLGLTACGGDEAEPPEDLQGRLDNAKRSMDEAESIRFTMSTDDLPDGVTGLLDAEGVGTHDPAFEGKVQVATLGSSVNADLISVGGDVYAKVAFAPAYIELDPADYGAPDPARLLDAETGVSTFLTSTEDVAGGDQVREGEEVLTAVSGTLPGDAVQSLFPSADAGGDFDVEYHLSDDDELRTAVVTGPFYPDTEDVTYSLSVDPSDEAVEITAP